MGDLAALCLVGLLVLVAVVMPIAAFVGARRARREVARLQLEMTELQIDVRDLRRAVAGVPPAVVEAPPRAPKPFETSPSAPMPSSVAAAPVVDAAAANAQVSSAANSSAESAAAMNASAESAAMNASAESAAMNASAESAAMNASAESAAMNASAESAAMNASAQTSAVNASSGSAAAMNASAQASTAANASAAVNAATSAGASVSAQAAPPSSLEERIALVWFTRIGAAVLLLGVAWFFKYAVDNDWIGPLGRVALGAIAGAAILAAAEALRPRTRTVYIQVLAGVGLALLYVSAYASHAFYHLVPAPAAFAAVGIITLLGGALAIHHEGEAILVLALIAGFASPVLLSTGEDRAAALFAYLLVLTSLAFYAALRMRFAVATWLAIAGPPLLFAGWYARFFDVAPPLADVRPAGDYFALTARAAPLVAVAAFFAQWIAVYTIARRRALTKLGPLWILCAAALASHAGFAALLYDHPLHLGAILSALALASSLLFGRENRRELLLLPLAAAFAVLVGTLHGDRRPDAIGVLSVLALWGAVYARAFLQGQLDKQRSPSPLMLWAVGAVGIAVAVSAAILLAEPHPRSFAVAIALLSLGYAALAVAVSRPLVAVAAAVVSLAAVGLADTEVTHDWRFIVVAGAWAAVYLGSVAWDVLKRGAEANALRLATFSVAGLGFVLLAEAQTLDRQWLLRALLVAGVGAVDLVFGAALLARKRSAAASVILGQALALFAAAFAYVFAGATLTLAWAAMAAVVAVLGAERDDRAWLAGASLLFGVAVVHLFAVDVEAPARARALFFATDGARGALRLPLLLNEKSYALAGTAAALIVAARAAARRSRTMFRAVAATMLGLGHLFILILLIAEAHTAILNVPRPQGPLAPDELSVVAQQFQLACDSAEQKLRMLATLVMGAYAALLVGIGFGLREKMHRYLGLSLFAATLLKLSLYDIWKLPRVYQMLVFLGVGVLLLGASFLYARFGKRLITLIRDGAIEKGAKAAIVVFFILLPSRARAFEPAALEFKRPIAGVNAPGLYRVPVDAALYRHAKSDALDDLRIAAPDGSEVAWLVRRVPPPSLPESHAVTLVDPVTLPDGSARATLDLGAAGLKHSQAQLMLVADGDFFRKTRVESSADEKEWAVLAEGAYVFRVGNTSEHTSIDYPLSDARYLRVTLLPAAGASAPVVRITNVSVAYDPPAERVSPGQLDALTPVPLPSPAGEAGTSSWLLDVGAPGVPIDGVRLEITTPAFERRVSLSASSQKQYWVPAGMTLLYRVPQAGAPQENVVVPAHGTRKQYLKIVIVNGDDAPLALGSARPQYVAEELVFRAPAAGAYTLFVGGALPPPSYDLQAVLARSNEQPSTTASFGALVANELHALEKAPPPPVSERYRVPIGVALSLLLGLLAWWTIRLMRRSKGDA